MDWNKQFSVKNISKGRVVAGAFSLGYGESRDVDPKRFPESSLKKLMLYKDSGYIEVSNIGTSEKKVKNEADTVRTVETIRNDNGDKREHVVFDPTKKDKAITVKSIDTDKAVKVESLIDDSPAVEVAYSEIDKIEALEFLSQHWKRVESEVNKVTSKKKLAFYLEVATQNEVADKKIEIIEDRLGQL